MSELIPAILTTLPCPLGLSDAMLTSSVLSDYCVAHVALPCLLSTISSITPFPGGSSIFSLGPGSRWYREMQQKLGYIPIPGGIGGFANWPLLTEWQHGLNPFGSDAAMSPSDQTDGGIVPDDRARFFRSER